MHWQATLKTVLTFCKSVLKQFILIVAVGTLVNWFFAVALFVLAFSEWTAYKTIGMFLIFAVGFPLAYLLVGKTYILRQAIYELVTTYKIMLLEYLLRQILSYSQPKSAKWQQVFQKGSQWLAGTPFPIRWVITGLVESLPIGEVLQQVIQNQELSNENITQLSQLAAQKLSEHLNVELLEPSPYPLIILAAINLAAVTIEIAL